ncbi:nucleolar gtp-binding protein 2 [Diplodia corticola]|uniref:Nucleolar gtp-binding protein 2 n=1 Tax=Diplodia corticola TaxID=236234 RepID=A0A1J9RRF8_9PEZI|nr:nucleolar gtp-binding protein 2 [Diplodia corticola]OJD30109.1 nucleolar gtp-binding protein 2 [Diplodia corticola]
MPKKRSRSESAGDSASGQPVEKRMKSNSPASVTENHNDSFTSASDNQFSRTTRRGRLSTVGVTYYENNPESDEETWGGEPSEPMWEVESCISIRPTRESAWDTDKPPKTSECETLLEWKVGGLSWEPMSENLQNWHIAQYVHTLSRSQRPRDYTFPVGFSRHIRRETALREVLAARRLAELKYPTFFEAEKSRYYPPSPPSSPSPDAQS